MKIILGADHRGFELKQTIKGYLLDKKYTVHDVGELISDTTDDYPDFASKAAREVIKSTENRGIVICGSGVGVCISANKIVGIRCGFGMLPEQVAASRADDDINMLALASDYVSTNDAENMVDAFLSTDFEANENHVRRINKITALEKNSHESTE